MALIEQVCDVLDQYAVPITVRQIFYRLVGLAVIAKAETEYDRLWEHVVRARRSMIIDRDVMADVSLERRRSIVHDDGDA